MKTFSVVCLSWFALFAIQTPSEPNAPLRLVQTIPMPGVHGRMDHLGVDVEGMRLFAAALGGKSKDCRNSRPEGGQADFQHPGPVAVSAKLVVNVMTQDGTCARDGVFQERLSS
jgi:hypothetical protein